MAEGEHPDGDLRAATETGATGFELSPSSVRQAVADTRQPENESLSNGSYRSLTDSRIAQDSAALTSAGSLALDDLHVGQRFESGAQALDAEGIKAFAAAFDPQPFHLDEAAARGTLFGGLAASGWHTAAVTMRLLVGGGAPFAGGLIGAGVELSWPRPARPGDVLRVFSEILALSPSRSKPDRGIVTLRSETRDARGEVLQIMVARLVVPRRGACRA